SPEARCNVRRGRGSRRACRPRTAFRRERSRGSQQMRPPSGEGAAAQTVPRDQSGASSYFQILRSTLLIGGSSMVAVLFAVIRNEAAAVLLGPEGIGLMGLYTVLLALAQGVASLG